MRKLIQRPKDKTSAWFFWAYLESPSTKYSLITQFFFLSLGECFDQLEITDEKAILIYEDDDDDHHDNYNCHCYHLISLW